MNMLSICSLSLALGFLLLAVPSDAGLIGPPTLTLPMILLSIDLI